MYGLALLYHDPFKVWCSNLGFGLSHLPNKVANDCTYVTETLAETYLQSSVSSLTQCCSLQRTLHTERNQKLENLDTVLNEKSIQELIGDEDEQATAKAKLAEETKKKKAKVEARLAEEKKAANRKAGQKKKGKKAAAADDDDGDDADAMAMFVKAKKKN